MTVDDLLIEARGVLPHRPGPAETLAAQAAGALLVDIRGDDQRRAGGAGPWRPCAAPQLAGVALRSRVTVAAPGDQRLGPAAHPDLHRGLQSSLAAATLHRLGLVNATDLDGGLIAWAAASLPLVARTRPRKRPS
jgi:3-mercaptopyruvate sulfurtransferase SseA